MFAKANEKKSFNLLTELLKINYKMIILWWLLQIEMTSCMLNVTMTLGGGGGGGGWRGSEAITLTSGFI